MRILAILPLISCLLLPRSLPANNNLFLPGDVFFPTTLTLDDIEQLAAVQNIEATFVYSSLGGYEEAFCGYAGYARAKVPKISRQFRANIREAYAFARENYEARMLREIKKGNKTELVEANGIKVLIYPASFEFPKYHLALRYNQEWTEECLKFGHTRQVRLCCLVDDTDAVMKSWRDSKFVSPLKVSLPQVELKPVPVTKAPITIEDEIKAYVLPFPLKDYMAPTEYLTALLVIDESGVTEFEYQEDGWIVTHRTETKTARHATEQPDAVEP